MYPCPCPNSSLTMRPAAIRPRGVEGRAPARNITLPARFRTAPAAPASFAAAESAAAAAARLFRAGFVDREAASADLHCVELFDGFLRIFVRGHFDERESACAARHLIAHHVDRLDGPGLGEQFLQLRLTRRVRKIPDIQLSTHLYRLLYRQWRRSRCLALTPGGCSSRKRLNFRRSESMGSSLRGWAQVRGKIRSIQCITSTRPPRAVWRRRPGAARYTSADLGYPEGGYRETVRTHFQPVTRCGGLCPARRRARRRSGGASATAGGWRRTRTRDVARTAGGARGAGRARKEHAADSIRRRLAAADARRAHD